MKKLAERFGFEPLSTEFHPRYNIAPGQEVPVVRRSSPKILEFMHWGLIPSWAKDKKIGYKMINARAESLLEKPSFKRPFQRRRCLVPTDGFYEWKKNEGKEGKIPYRITMKNRELFAFAGLWDIWRDPEGSELHSFTIITTEANELLKPIHNRMPVILRPEAEEAWLDIEGMEIASLQKLLKPYASKELLAYPVGKLVNSPRNDSPQCIQEVVEDESRETP